MIVPLSVQYGKRFVAVLKPQEWFAIKDKLNDAYKIRGEYLLQTAMRISEAAYILEHQDCFREDHTTIFLPHIEGKGKVRSKVKSRQIMLSDAGVAAVKEIFEKNIKLLPYQNMEQVFKRAARDADFDTKYITTKMLRKTMISWLMACFPEKQEMIAFGAGHDYNTMRQHYLTFGWRKEDISDMRIILKGWNE
jgi:integrase